MLRIILVAVLVMTLQLSVSAQDNQKAQLVQKLYDLSQDVSGGKITPVRGGTKQKPLGVYLGTKDVNWRIIFPIFWRIVFQYLANYFSNRHLVRTVPGS